MKTIANRVYRPIAGTIIWGIVISFIVAIILFSFFAGITQLLGLVMFWVAIVICGLILIFRVLSIVRANEDETPPIYADGNTIYCYNGKAILEFPIWDLYCASGKLKGYLRYYLIYWQWGKYNYGNVTVYFDDEGRKRHFTIRHVLKADEAADRLMQYVEKQAKAKEIPDYYQILRVRTDSTQQEISQSYENLKNQNPDNLEEIEKAFEVLSSLSKKIEYDAAYWAVHED